MTETRDRPQNRHRNWHRNWLRRARDQSRRDRARRDQAWRDQSWRGWSPDGARQQPVTRQIHRLSHRMRAFDRRHPLVWDVLVTGFFVTAAFTDVLGGGWRYITQNPQAPTWLIVTLSLGFTVPLLWRRTHPVAILLPMLPLAVVNAWTGTDLQSSLTLLVVTFNIALHTALRTLLASYAVTMIPIVVDGFRNATEQAADQSPDQTIVPQATRLAMVAIVGISYRTRQEYLASLVERAAQLEVERDQQARLATAAERTRIAREMHDIIGHNLSVITSLADGGSYAAAKNPERAAQALTAIGTTSRQALGELRRLLDVLRTDPSATEPPGAEPPGPALGPALGLEPREWRWPPSPPSPTSTTSSRAYAPPASPSAPPSTATRPPSPGPPTHRLPSHPGSPDEHPQARRPRRDLDGLGVVREWRRRDRDGDRHRPRKHGSRQRHRGPRPHRNARTNCPVRRHT